MWEQAQHCGIDWSLGNPWEKIEVGDINGIKLVDEVFTISFCDRFHTTLFRNCMFIVINYALLIFRLLRLMRPNIATPGVRLPTSARWIAPAMPSPAVVTTISAPSLATYLPTS